MPRRLRVIRLPAEDAYTIKPSELGGHEVVSTFKPVYMCGGCNLVWTTRFHAEGCEIRGHVSEFVQDMYLNGNEHPDDKTTYTFTAIRRETEGNWAIDLPPEPKRERTHQSYKLGEEEVLIMQRDRGQYRPDVAIKPVYMCGSCGLVWPLKFLADACEPRGHVTSVVQTYYTTRRGGANTWVEYTYTPLRREKPLRGERG